MGVGRDRRGNFRRLDGLSTTFCMASEHAFLEDIGRPSVRLFVDNVVCDVYNCLLGQSYACLHVVVERLFLINIGITSISD